MLYISISSMCPKGADSPGFPTVLRTATCMLLLFSSTCSTRADVHPVWENEKSLLGEVDLQEDFEDLPEGFHKDVDSITIAAGGHHTCALEYRPGVDFGGPVRCWGRNDWGQSSPPEDIFVQVWIALKNSLISRNPEDLSISTLPLLFFKSRAVVKGNIDQSHRCWPRRRDVGEKFSIAPAWLDTHTIFVHPFRTTLS